MKIKKLLSLTLCIGILSTTLLNGCTPDKEPAVYDPSFDSSSTAAETPTYQAKLSQIKSPAYRTTQGLTVEAGTYFSYLGKESNTNYSKEIEAGIKQAISDLNTHFQYTGSNAITYSYNGPKTPNDLNEQINILDAELARYPLSLGIAPLDNNAYQTQFDLAFDNGIQLVAFDTSSTQSNATTVVGTNAIPAMIDAVEHLTNSMKTSGEIIILTNNATKPSIEMLIDSVNVYLTNSKPEYTLLTVLNVDDSSIIYQIPVDDDASIVEDTEPSEDQPSDNGSTIEPLIPEELEASASTDEQLSNILSPYDGKESVGYITTDSTTCQLLLDYLDTLDNDTHYSIVSFDANNAQQEALKSGQIDGLILRNPFAIGYATVIASVRATLDTGNDSYVDTGHTLITADNLTTEAIEALLY